MPGSLLRPDRRNGEALILKVVHAVGWFLPESFGGTERYVDGLVRSLAPRGVVSEVFAARDGERVNGYDLDGVTVTRYPVGPGRTRSQLRGDAPHDGFADFQRLLAARTPDVYHQHSWSLGCGLHHLRAAVSLGIPSVLTVHVPGNICPNGTMMRGELACDGFLDTRRCAGCVLEAKGLSRGPASLAASLPVAWSERLASLPGSFGTVAGTRNMMAVHRSRLLEAYKLASRVVVVADWLNRAMRINGIGPDRIRLSRHGGAAIPTKPRPQRQPGPVRIGFLGRWDRVKGVDILVRAVRHLDPTVEVELSVHALAQGQDGENYRREVVALAEGDPRIKLHSPLAPGQVADFLATADVLAVPSQGLETGPLVVLEALAVGTPVLGAALGGIKEWVVDGQNGWLVKHDDVQAWSAAIHRLAVEGACLEFDAPTRTVEDIADEMHALYSELVPIESVCEV